MLYGYLIVWFMEILKIQYLTNFQDLTWREFLVFLPLLLGTFVMGIYPEVFLEVMHASINNVVSQINS